MKIQLLQAPVELAVGDSQGHCLVVHVVRFFVGRGRVGLLHEVGGLFDVLFLLCFDLLDLLADGVQIFRFFVVSLIAVAAHASLLPEEVFAIVEGLELHVIARQDHVGSVTVLAAALGIFLRKKRPQPVFIVAMSFFNAGSSAPIALMARGAAEFLGIVNLQQFRLGMADQSLCVLVRLLLAFLRHRGGRDLQRFARAHMTGLAPVDDIRLGHIDLNDRRIPVGCFLLQPVNLGRSQIDHVVGKVFVQLGFGGRHRLQNVAEFQAQFSAFVADLVVRLFEFVEIVFLPGAVRVNDRGLLVLVGLEVFLPAGFRGQAGGRLDLVRKCVDIRATVGEYALHCQQARAGVVEFLSGLSGLSRGIVAGFFPGRVERRVFRIFLDIFFRGRGLRFRRIQKCRVAVFPLFLKCLPRTLPPSLIPQSPKQRGNQEEGGDEIMRGIGLVYNRILLGDWLLRHRFLPPGR